MVRGRTTRRDRAARRTRPLTETGGARLKQAVHVARAKAGITSDTQLALRANVSYDTLMNWYGGKTVPRGFELEKVAKATGTSLWVLQAAYEGRAPEPPPLQDAIRDLADEMNRQTAAISSLVGEFQRDRTARAEAIEARLRAVEAEVRSPRERPTGGGLPEQSAPRG
jgi:transcriptional regulator with XRE-family HTH domain